MSGNKTDNGVHEVGTDEIRLAYQNDTPGQDVEGYIKEQEKSFHEQKNRSKKHFSQVFQNPLDGYPYNESITVRPIKEDFGMFDLSEGMKMKDIMRKHGRELKKAQRSGNLELSKKAEDDLMSWVFDNEPSIGDDPDDFIDWLDMNLDDIVKGKIREGFKSDAQRRAAFASGYKAKGKKGKKEEVKEGFFMKEFEDGEYIKGDEKMYVDIIKKSGGKNIKVYAPDRRDPQLSIEFDGGNLKKMEKELDRKGDGTEAIEETTDKEIKAVQKLSKDMQSVLKGYQKITGMGDKELKNTKHNDTYKAVLDARDKVLTLIGTLQTDKLLKGEELKTFGDIELELNENEKGLKNKAEKSGISLSILKKVYDRGLAAYKTGHRPGATAPQWAMARVNSFITKGEGTWGKADKDLADKVRGSKK